MNPIEADYVGKRFSISGSKKIVRGVSSLLIHVGSAEKLTNDDLKRFVKICAQIAELSDPNLLLPLYSERKKQRPNLGMGYVWSEFAQDLVFTRLAIEDVCPKVMEEMKTQARLGIMSVTVCIEDFLNEIRPIEDFNFEQTYPNITALAPIRAGLKPIKSICPFAGFAKRWYETALQVIRMAQSENTTTAA